MAIMATANDLMLPMSSLRAAAASGLRGMNMKATGCSTSRDMRWNTVDKILLMRMDLWWARKKGIINAKLHNNNRFPKT